MRRELVGVKASAQLSPVPPCTSWTVNLVCYNYDVCYNGVNCKPSGHLSCHRQTGSYGFSVDAWVSVCMHACARARVCDVHAKIVNFFIIPGIYIYTFL